MKFLDKILSENRLVSCIILTLQVVLLYVLFSGLVSSSITNHLTKTEQPSKIVKVEIETTTIEFGHLEATGDGIVYPIEPSIPGKSYEQTPKEPVEFVGKLKTLKGTTRAHKEYRFDDDIENKEDFDKNQEEFNKVNTETPEPASRIWA